MSLESISSMSWFKFLNLWIIINDVTKSPNHKNTFVVSKCVVLLNCYLGPFGSIVWAWMLDKCRLRLCMSKKQTSTIKIGCILFHFKCWIQNIKRPCLFQLLLKTREHTFPSLLLTREGFSSAWKLDLREEFSLEHSEVGVMMMKLVRRCWCLQCFCNLLEIAWIFQKNRKENV